MISMKNYYIAVIGIYSCAWLIPYYAVTEAGIKHPAV